MARGNNLQLRCHGDVGPLIEEDAYRDLPICRDDFRIPLAALSDFERTVLILRCFHAVKQTRIAELLDISPGEVYTTLSSALSKIRDSPRR